MAENFRYVRLADELEGKIRNGDFAVGEKLPSIRRLHSLCEVSITTAYQAMVELEKRNLLEVRPRSGFYVKQPVGKLALPTPRQGGIKASGLDVNNLFAAFVEAMGNPGLVQLGGAAPAPELLPVKKITRALRAALNGDMRGTLTYDQPQGHRGLRREIAKRMLLGGCDVPADEIVITNGCMEAVYLCLRAITRPGDVVAVESPTFPGFLQIMEDLELGVLEVPTDPVSGIDLDCLEEALAGREIAACILVPNVNNPLGYVMDEGRKKRLVEITGERDIPIIEDGVYNDLYFGKGTVSTLKSYDQKGLVLFCSSFSKTLAPGLRVGWVVPGKYFQRVKRYKLNSSVTGPGMNQQVVLDCLKTGYYDRHLRKMRNDLKTQVGRIALAVGNAFPGDTKISSPEGGLLLWVELSGATDGVRLFRKAMEQGIAVMPGLMCSGAGLYDNCIRLNCAFPPDRNLEGEIRKLGAIIRETAV